jgi:NADH:ubiquinone oxidoreductase subunit E
MRRLLHSHGEKAILSEEERQQMMGMMNSRQLRTVIIEVLNDINSHKQLESEESIMALAELLRHVLSRKVNTFYTHAYCWYSND